MLRMSPPFKESGGPCSETVGGNTSSLFESCEHYGLHFTYYIQHVNKFWRHWKAAKLNEKENLTTARFFLDGALNNRLFILRKGTSKAESNGHVEQIKIQHPGAVNHALWARRCGFRQVSSSRSAWEPEHNSALCKAAGRSRPQGRGHVSCGSLQGLPGPALCLHSALRVKWCWKLSLEG